MNIINKLLESMVFLLDALLPALGFSPEFMSSLDSSMAFVVNAISAVGYFIPLGILSFCAIAIFTVENFIFLTRPVFWLIRTVRGG